MRVRISMPGAYTAMEVNEERAYQTFQKLNEVLLSLQTKTIETEQEPQKDVIQAICEEKMPEPESESEDIIRPKYYGFLYIRCHKCGEIKGFYTKRETDHYHCDYCGESSVFEERLVLLWVNCECGRQFRYQTNMTEKAFDISCLACGTPVAVEWNEKKAVYETIK